LQKKVYPVRRRSCIASCRLLSCNADRSTSDSKQIEISCAVVSLICYGAHVLLRRVLLYNLSAIRERRLCSLNIEWMLRCTGGINAEAEQFRVAVSNLVRSLQELAMISPTGDA